MNNGKIYDQIKMMQIIVANKNKDKSKENESVWYIVYILPNTNYHAKCVSYVNK